MKNDSSLEAVVKTALSRQTPELLAFFAFIGFLLLARIYFTGELRYLFLVWNIFLAWIPFVISSKFNRIVKRSIWLRGLFFCCWLIFFPNALYIVTDLIHLELDGVVPKWFDVVLLFSSSVVGLMMAFISLYRVEKYFLSNFDSRLRSFLIVSIMFLGAFGVYLGRFLRWNSWDILSNPLQLITSIGHRIVFPLNHLHTWSTTVIFTMLFYLLYSSIKNLGGSFGVKTALRSLDTEG